MAREQAEKSSRVKHHFLGMISHELRTPMTTILLNTQLLAHPKNGELPKSCKPWLERLTRAAQQLAALIEGVLEYTRIESGRLALQLRTVGPKELIQLIQELVDAQAEHAAPDVSLRFEASAPRDHSHL